jgi:hypothetical protein
MIGYKPFGKMTIEPLFHQTELKSVGMHSSPWVVLESFVRQTEAVASRIAFGRNGAVILTTIPGDPNSGAFYLWDRSSKSFYTLEFENQDNFNPTWFDIVFTTYDLQELLDGKNSMNPKPARKPCPRVYVAQEPVVPVLERETIAA